MPAPKKSDVKLDWAIAIALLHGKIIDKLPAFAEDEEKRIDESSIECGGFANKEEKDRELALPFYNLPASAKAIFQQRKYNVSSGSNALATNDAEELWPLSPGRRVAFADQQTPCFQRSNREISPMVEDRATPLYMRTPVYQGDRNHVFSPMDAVVAPTPEDVANSIENMML